MGCPLSKNGNESDSNNAGTAGTAGGAAAANNAATTKASAAAAEQSGKNGDGAATGASAKAADPRLPLNVRQKFNLSKSWKGISREMEMTGVLMFVK